MFQIFTNNRGLFFCDYLLERGVVPEDLPAEEDVKKVERRLASEKKKAIENKRKKSSSLIFFN